MDCKICKNSLQLKFQNQQDINFRATENSYNWFECEHCGVLSISPIQKTDKSEDLSAFYGNYAPHSGSIQITHDLSVETKITINIKHLQQHFLPEDDFSVLDIGCGNGEMLANLRNYFPKSTLYGLDYNVNHAEDNLTHSHVSLFEGDLHSANLEKEFDVIISSQLLEHIEDPWDFINFVERHSHKKTVILTDIPNLEAKSFEKFQDKWVHLDTPRHRNLFTVKSLELLFNNFELSNFKSFGTNYVYISSFKLKYGVSPTNTSIPIKALNLIINTALNLFISPDDKIHFVAHYKNHE